MLKKIISLFFVSLLIGLQLGTVLGQEDYRLGSEDEIEIRVWSHDDLTRKTRVGLNGTISFPFVGEIKARGLSIMELQKELERRLGPVYIIDPHVSISVTEYKSQKFFVVGNVQKPGTYPLTKPVRIVEAISQAGGISSGTTSKPLSGAVAIIIRAQPGEKLDLTNGVYLEVEIFGRRHLINQHFSYGRIQPIFMRVNSGGTRGTTRLSIINSHREVLAFGSPSLSLADPKARDTWTADSVRLPSFFPVGIFAATPDDLAAIRAAGFNAVQSYDSRPEIIRRMAAACRKLGLKFLPNFRSYQADISRDLGGNPELLGFYIEDEPEGRSVSPESMQALKESLKNDHPDVLTAVAMLRPQMVAAYRQAADVFMIDPYPVPHMPMTWLSDSLEEAARHVPKEHLWAVIQAFGGEKWARHGWPRCPTQAEMRCLTYLSLVHGAHGVFYFSYPEVRKDPAAWAGLQKIVGELRELRTWLVLSNEATALRLEMTSPFKTDAAGHPAVHFCHKQKGADNLLILVNVIDRPVSFYLQGFPRQVALLTECFHRHNSVVRDGNIREELGPYEVHLYSYRQQD